MARFLDVGRYRALTACLFIALALAATGLAATAEPALPPQLTPAEAATLSREGKLTIVDVRSPAEWRETGVAAGARTVTFHDPRGAEGFVDAMLKAVGGDKDRPVAMICHSGTRSLKAQKILAAAGFTHVTDISAGMAGTRDQPGWIAQGLPTAPCNC